MPIIAMAADVYAEDTKLCLDAGTNGHMGKPAGPETLYNTLEDAIS